MSYDKAAIERIVKRIVYAVDHNQYHIARNENRTKNVDFLAEYEINETRLKDILSGLNADDFSESVQNVNPAFELEQEKLYIFGLKRRLLPVAEDEYKNVEIYVKVNIIERKIDDFVMLISIHEAEEPMSYAFK